MDILRSWILNITINCFLYVFHYFLYPSFCSFGQSIAKLQRFPKKFQLFSSPTLHTLQRFIIVFLNNLIFSGILHLYIEFFLTASSWSCLLLTWQREAWIFCCREHGYYRLQATLLPGSVGMNGNCRKHGPWARLPGSDSDLISYQV